MKKRIFIAIFVFLVIFPNKELNAENLQKTEKTSDLLLNPTVSVEQIFKKDLTKKEIKVEIKKRKKYHKSLLEKYNESFEEKYLNMISKNSQYLSKLRIDLKK